MKRIFIFFAFQLTFSQYDQTIPFDHYRDIIEVINKDQFKCFDKQIICSVFSEKYYFVLRGFNEKYIEYFLSFDAEKNNIEILSKKNINKDFEHNIIFNKDLYWRGHITTNSEFFLGKNIKMFHENVSIFCVWNNEQLFFASYTLPFTISPHPLDDKIYEYLYSKMVPFIMSDFINT